MPNRLPVIPCENRHLNKLEAYIAEMELDGRNIDAGEFMLIEGPTRIKAFGRIKHFDGYDELCTLGVVKDLRHLGLGAKLVKALCQASNVPLYLVCIIPDWFKTLGFEICSNYPEMIEQKRLYCTNHLLVETPYVVMKFVGLPTEN
jgi:N-acetylglutamate synthase-like GNAT family acetyltransferase